MNKTQGGSMKAQTRLPTSSMTWLGSDAEGKKLQKLVIEYSMDATREEINNDMRLISAAPELLDQLKLAFAWIRNASDLPHFWDRMPRGLEGTESIEAAIKDCEGE